MKLLIVTQKVDSEDPILGFFVSWISEFARSCDHVTVLTQSVGAHALPVNVEVISLGKDRGASQYKQVFSFWKLILQKRSSYDRVFVHMTPIWIVLGGPLWLLLRKRMYLWYEIKRGSTKLSVALWLVKKVFAASEHGLPEVSKKQVIVGHGIDTNAFTPDEQRRESNHLVAIGRVTAVKHYEVIVRALHDMPNCTLTIAGGTVTEADKTTEKELRDLMHTLGVADKVSAGWVNPTDVPALLQRADCMLHASQGGLDKAVLQAMACGCPVVTTSEAAQSVLPSECHATNSTMASKTVKLLALSQSERHSLAKKLRAIVVQHHSLHACISQMISEMS